jgi:hypothetical protein
MAIVEHTHLRVTFSTPRQYADASQPFRLLRMRRERAENWSRATKQSNELPSPHSIALVASGANKTISSCTLR